jgi:hypothetical protein
LLERKEVLNRPGKIGMNVFDDRRKDEEMEERSVRRGR